MVSNFDKNDKFLKCEDFCQISGFFSIRGQVTTACLSEIVRKSLFETNFSIKEGEEVLFVAGKQTVIYAFSLQSHEIIDIWTVGENVTSIDCFGEKGVILMAIGSENGRIFIRKNSEDHPSEIYPSN